MEDLQTVVVPTITPQVETPIQAPVVEKDLITKVSEFKKSQSQSQVPAKSNNEAVFFDYKEIENIKDPIAKEIAMRAYKSMESGVQKKFQDLAAQRRETESREQSVQQKLAEMQNWSPERIQKELLGNPQFLQAAQQIAQVNNPTNSGITDEQFSALTPEEKAEINGLKSQINSLQQTNYQASVAQRDSQLQARYTDYNPQQIDNTIRDLANMNPLDIREHVYKSLRFADHGQSCYEMGLAEGRGLTQNKINAITPNGSSGTVSNNLPVREKSDTDQTYFMKMAIHNLAEYKNRK